MLLRLPSSIMLVLATLTTNSLVGLPRADSQTKVREILSLQKGRTVTGSFGNAETRSYHLRARKGDYIRIEVQQRGVDVLERVLLPDGRRINDFDSPTGDSGIDTASFCAPVSGLLVVQITPLEPGEHKGRYELTLREVRRATPRELARADAEQEVFDADRKWGEAINRFDAKTVARLCGEEITHLYMNPQAADSRDRIVQNLKASGANARSHNSNSRWDQHVHWKMSRVTGNIGYVQKSLTQVQFTKGKETDRLFQIVTEAWQKQNGRWQMIADDLKPGSDRTPRTAVALGPDILALYEGRYEITPSITMTIKCKSDHLLWSIPDTGADISYYPESDTDFFAKETPAARLFFIRDAQGRIVEAISIYQGSDMVCKRLP